MFAIVYTSIANALVIISTGPIMIAIVAWFLLKEKSSLITWASMVIVFIGIYIVMSGSFGGKSLVGDFFALITAVMMGFTFTLTRKYKDVNMVPVNAIGGLIAALIAFLMANQITVKNKIEDFNKSITVSGDKSLSIRWVLFSSIAKGKSKAYNLLLSEDVLAAINAVKKLGAKVKLNKNYCTIIGLSLIHI